METLVQLRGTYRGCFTKFIEKLEAFLKTEVDDSDLYVSHLSQLTEKYTKIQHLNDKILKLIQGKDRCIERDICNEIESAESYEDKFIYWRTKLERCISRADNGIDTHSVSESISNKRSFKLPKIELQKFDGGLKDWLSFWGLFKKIDEDSDIPNEDKYQYLIQSTLKGSRAREVVESFPPTAENYTQAIECLKARFGREDVLVEVYVRELLSLVLNNVLNNEHKLPLINRLSAQRTQTVKLYDRIETQLRSLQMLGVTSDKYASMLYPLVESCLPINLLRIWERHLSSITFKSEADVAGKLLTGGYKLLPSDLVAIETRLGWTVMGRTRREKGDENTDLIVTSMLTREISETDLWNLDAIGIKDQAEKHSKMEQEEAARQHFFCNKH
ncbi:hypothetical protein AVEN_24543-1 [Araneus ventricosus]|uniref:Uncharacterized protein n=1 Tax=Araneus ventricosus TaxID=182803 RepID=A0A4Y2WFN8_ARAVE|nr:hypothetical protein AVEN_24543-1 [Araneus ventricosus]